MTADVIVIGGGLSGLAAAIKLSLSGAKVVLLEQKSILGGRTYSFTDSKTGDEVDNGQHILVGAYHKTLKYLELIGTKHFLKRQSKPRLYFHHQQKGLHIFEISNLPKPFDITAAMLNYKILSFRERNKLLRVGLELKRWNEKFERKLSQLSVDSWLDSLNQSDEAKRSFWNPIVISVMNETPSRASALLFARSLRNTFLDKKIDADVLIPTVGQTKLYVEQAVELLKKNKSEVITNAKVKSIIVSDGAAVGVEAVKKIKSKYIISSVPYYNVAQLIPKNYLNHIMFNELNLFESSPIVSINLWFDKNVIDIEFVGLINRNLQWIFNRRRISEDTTKPENYISAVISAARDEIKLTKDELVKMAVGELKEVFPDCRNAQLTNAIVIKEKRATYSATNEVESIRPNPTTPIKNFYLAGDWTNTGLPATIEGAIQSGFKCAELVISSKQ
ncbi:MAG: hydroxysqualene dehydroxylase HpnE [Bacteroidota bacterium]|nr:hydroxysqualene dehydroxylase HpnE [Bacteroidota bacterium]